MSLLKNRRGMTLIEIMIVLAIIGSIAALLLPAVTGQLDKSKVKEARIQMTQIVNALSMYYTDCGKYPQSLEGLTTADANCSNWGPQPYATAKKLKDPWGNDFVYEPNGADYNLKSLGKNKQEGGSGYDKDISLEDLDSK
jgi:general secretion pathway protein G